MADRSKKDEHDLGIDLLRLISMLMVAVNHVLLHGGLLQEADHFRHQYKVVWFLEISVFCAVNVFGLISGYVGYGRKHKLSRLVKMYFQMAFYTLLTTACFAIWKPELVTGKVVINAVFPFSHEAYWYCTAYLCLSFFMPFLDRLVSSLKKTEAQSLIAVSFVLFSVLQTISGRQFTFTNNGYCSLWLTILYLGGAYIKKYNVGARSDTHRFLAGYVISVLFVWFTKMGTEHLCYLRTHEYTETLRLVKYTSPFVIVCAVCLVLTFKEMELHLGFTKVISFFTPVVLDIYLFHDEPLIREYVVKGAFTGLLNLNLLPMILSIIGTGVGIWVAGSIIGFSRRMAFKVLHMNQFCKWCEIYWDLFCGRFLEGCEGLTK